MRELDLQRITSLGFRTFKVFQNLKLLSGFIYLIFVSLFQCSLFVPEDRSIEEKIGPKNIQVLLFS